MLFFLFLVVFNNFFTSLRLALAISIGVPITVAKYAIEMLPLVADKQLKVY